MSAEQDRVRELASRIARRVSLREDAADTSVSYDETGREMASVRESINELKRKLALLEENLSHDKGETVEDAGTYRFVERGAPLYEASAQAPPVAARSPWLSGMYVPAAHPSQEKFGVEEAAVSELVDFFEKEKVCELEPGGKPCTHCAMCNTLGF